MMLDNILYMYSNMDNSSQLLLFLIILVALMLISIFIINIITKKRNEKYDKKFNSLNKYNEVVQKQFQVKKEKVAFDDTKNEKDTKKNLKENIEIMSDPEVIEVVSDDNSIDKISMLIEDDINNKKPIDLTKFEEEEERNAIISYDELVKRAGAKKIIYKTEKNTINEEIKEDKIEIKKENKSKFRASQVISPIYGTRKHNEENNKLEEFIDLEEIKEDKKNYIDQDLQKDMTFLTGLKNFRSNLD